MDDFLLANEPLIRLGLFLGILLAMAIWEVAAPRRRREIPRLIRWSNNLGVVVIDTLLVRLTFPIVAVALAVIAEERGWGGCSTSSKYPPGSPSSSRCWRSTLRSICST
ncbi:hypothetical protein QW131_29040 [Roseibium salinum]|nr:hypothetical protein [Roseibium salinum]